MKHPCLHVVHKLLLTIFLFFWHILFVAYQRTLMDVWRAVLCQCKQHIVLSSRTLAGYTWNTAVEWTSWMVVEVSLHYQVLTTNTSLSWLKQWLWTCFVHYVVIR